MLSSSGTSLITFHCVLLLKYTSFRFFPPSPESEPFWMQNNGQRSGYLALRGTLRSLMALYFCPPSRNSKNRWNFCMSLTIELFHLDGEADRKSGSASKHHHGYFAGGTTLLPLNLVQHTIPDGQVSVANMSQISSARKDRPRETKIARLAERGVQILKETSMTPYLKQRIWKYQSKHRFSARRLGDRFSGSRHPRPKPADGSHVQAAPNR